MRDSSPCIFQSHPSHPDRFKCGLQPTVTSALPGDYDNEDVALIGKNGCLIVVQPVTWAWGGNAFIFQSSESLDALNSCFDSNTLITESFPTDPPSLAPSVAMNPPTTPPTPAPTPEPTNPPTAPPTPAPTPEPTAPPTRPPTSEPTVPTDVVLLREDTPCIFQSNPSNHPDRFKCMIHPTTPNSEPGEYGVEHVGLRGSGGCLLIIQPVTWAWEGNAFIFQSSDSLDAINECFAPGSLITESSPTATPSVAPSASVISPIPPGVVLQRDGTPCIFQSNPSNHPDRFKCMVEPTTLNTEPGTYDNDAVWLKGGDCILAVQPVSWAWDGNAFIFQTSESLAKVNACFGAGILITASSEIVETSIFD